MTLADFRTRYLTEAQQPARLPAWPGCERAVGLVSALCAGFRRRAARAPPGWKTAPLGPVSPRFGAFDFCTRIKDRRGEPRRSSHKAPQCGAFFGFRHRRSVAGNDAGERW